MLAYNTSYNSAIKETPYYIFFLRDAILPYVVLLKPKVNIPAVKSYPQELKLRANRAFSICKAFSDQTKTKRNAKANENRKFKDIEIGSRIYIKKMLRKNKLGSKFAGLLRVEGLSGSTVFCYDLSNGKAKQVTMTRCRHAEIIMEEDNDNINNVYPEDEVLDDREEEQNSEDNLETPGSSTWTA